MTASPNAGDSKLHKSSQTVFINPATCWIFRRDTSKQNHIGRLKLKRTGGERYTKSVLNREKVSAAVLI